MPSGGVSAQNMTDYLSIPAVPAVSGSWMVDPALLAEKRWDEVTARAAAAIRTAEQVPPHSSPFDLDFFEPLT